MTYKVTFIKIVLSLSVTKEETNITFGISSLVFNLTSTTSLICDKKETKKSRQKSKMARTVDRCTLVRKRARHAAISEPTYSFFKRHPFRDRDTCPASFCRNVGIDRLIRSGIASISARYVRGRWHGKYSQ